MRRLTAAVALAAVITATAGVPAHAYAAGIGRDVSVRAAGMASTLAALQAGPRTVYASCPR